MSNTITPAEHMRLNGYAVYRSIFTPDEIEKLRSTIANHFTSAGKYFEFGKIQPDAFGKISEIRWACSHPPLVAAFHECTGIDDLRYTYHSDVHMNALSNWHTDTQAYFTPKEVLVDDFRVYKVGIYLQDHLENGQGLTVCEGSHLTGAINPENTKTLSTKAGDVIIFDVRIYHHGDMKNFAERVVNKITKNGAVNFRVGKIIRKLTNRADKLSLFFTYGANNEMTREFSIRNMKRQNRQNGVADGVERDEAMAAFLAASNVQAISL
ncbi:phytanoyl-CoA dioxygenase family protein [Planctomicrobium sp. SH661]|uniref:phytanoyl-CoA dioxygenase family protein n=1 Tax=Planctomicrobium sp. SH661 TaxID=3448124 RepID=UPI003F5C58ED